MTGRTQKGMKNINVSMAYLVIDTFLRFISRTVLLENIGTELLGLNTTAYNILEFLNLAELGIGTATAVTLYKPLFENDTHSVREIIALQGYFYKWISSIVIVGGLIVMAFFPWIFAKAEVPAWCPYAAFTTFLFGNVIGNFVNYRQILLTSDQKGYKILYYHKSVMLIKAVAQILAVSLLNNGYVWWLALEAVFAVIGALSLRYVTNKEYPYLRDVDLSFKDLRIKYFKVLQKIRQIFIHKITTFIVLQITPLIIYGYISLTEVALYANYMTVITGLYTLGNSLYSGLMPGIGNLVAEGDAGKNISVYKELFYMRFAFSAVALFGLLLFMPSFITLWIGKEYVLDSLTLYLMAGFLFIRLNRAVIDMYIGAYGLYADIWSPIAEGITNLALAILGGYFFGLNGIIAGNMVGTVLVVLIWKPYYLFTRGLKASLSLYYAIYIKCMVIFIPVGLIAGYIVKSQPLIPSTSWTNLIVVSLLGCSVLLLGIMSLFYATSSSVRHFVGRFR